MTHGCVEQRAVRAVGLDDAGRRVEQRQPAVGDVNGVVAPPDLGRVEQLGLGAERLEGVA